MKQTKYYLALTDWERSLLLKALINMRNTLIADGRYTDLIDETICKLSKAKKKNFKVKTA